LIRFVAETGSTNADLLALGDDAREGEWLVALRQSAGRGRAGRGWEDGAGNFMGSTVVRLQSGDPPAHTLALVTGLAVFETVAAMSGAPAGLQLKWPNDVLVDGAKLAGVLLERQRDTVVVGVGVNLARAPELADRRATSLAGLTAAPDVRAFAEHLAHRFAVLLDAWRAGKWGELRARWLANAHPEGTPLAVRDRDGAPISGVFAGLGAEGAALLRLADGTTQPIHAGDVELIGGGDASRG
jgi:BirA family biotin operon repressor/biotin-[acetyl-CoA-carboxylase] ligase